MRRRRYLTLRAVLGERGMAWRARRSRWRPVVGRSECWTLPLWRHTDPWVAAGPAGTERIEVRRIASGVQVRARRDEPPRRSWLLTFEQWRAFHDGVIDGSVMPQFDRGYAWVSFPGHSERMLVSLECWGRFVSGVALGAYQVTFYPRQPRAGRD